MKLMRTAVTILLLLFVGATVGTLIAQQVARPDDAQPSLTEPEDRPVETSELPPNAQASGDIDASPGVQPDMSADTDTQGSASTDEKVPVMQDVQPVEDTACTIEAVYFHNTHRCVTCLKIEGDAKAIVEQAFADELASGLLRWSTMNMEDNPSLIVQYDLASPSLVLLRKVGDQVVDWTLLEETWALVRSTTRYRAYIIECFREALEACR